MTLAFLVTIPCDILIRNYRLQLFA